MCLLCIEMAKDNLTKDIFVDNYLELITVDPKHAEEVLDKWLDKKYSEVDVFDLD